MSWLQLHVLVFFYCATTQSYHLGLSRKVSHKISKWVEKKFPTKLESELKKFQVSWISKCQVNPRSTSKHCEISVDDAVAPCTVHIVLCTVHKEQTAIKWCQNPAPLVTNYTNVNSRIGHRILSYHFPSFFHYNSALSKCILTGFLSSSSRHLSYRCMHDFQQIIMLHYFCSTMHQRSQNNIT